MTIDELFEKYPKIFNPDYNWKINWYGIPDAWIPFIDTLCNTIQSYIDNQLKYSDREVCQVECTTLKEKYGSLRFYYSGGDNHIEGMIDLAEEWSTQICISCGTNQNIGCTSGWIAYMCKDCATKEEVIDRWNKE